MRVDELRSLFLDFFKGKGHRVVSSSPLVPEDKTLLFTNAGMVQFKQAFLESASWPYQRATSAQCCVRAGGKHNDLENVGYTARHHTFFEMLGNFSFGDYFKREAIFYAWEFLTQVLKLSPEKLWVTVYKEDKEAEAIWLNEVKVDRNRFSRCGEEDNFWSMGETGPCGPCTEIFYDHGTQIAGGPPGTPDQAGDRYVEIWNLVFMQYNRDAKGELHLLSRPSVDTGMGLERLAAVMQGVHSNYEIDLFVHLISAASRITGGTHLSSLRVIADHIRSSAFLIAEGVLPANDGRGYVLRRIVRRALRHGNKLGAPVPFFYHLVAPLVEMMGQAYPQLRSAQARIEKILLKEEEQFTRTLEQGLKILEQDIQQLKKPVISGQMVFKLYDTYGFPVDLTADIARERQLSIDRAGFEREMEIQRQRARASSTFSASIPLAHALDWNTEFVGYDALQSQSPVLALLQEDESVSHLGEKVRGTVILAQTPFYPQSGGQVGDQGILQGSQGLFLVEDTQRQGEAIVHRGIVQEGTIQAGEVVTAVVERASREATRLNHSATHLLHAALREILGSHVVQKGSLVEPARLRFDFSHFEPLSAEQIMALEQRVNEKILENSEAVITVMTPEEAIQAGALALFGEKYGETVRVLNMGGGYSVELCGGTHVARTGDIGLFKIVSEMGIASGIRRIEALTGKGALAQFQSTECCLQQCVQLLKATSSNVVEKITQLIEKNRELEKEQKKLKAKLIAGAGDVPQFAPGELEEVAGIKVIVKRLADTPSTLMRELIDNLKSQLGKTIILLAAVNGEKVQLIAGVTNNCTDKISAIKLVNMAAEKVGGKGGGRPDLAQAGGSQPERLEEALQSAMGWVKAQLSERRFEGKEKSDV